MVMKDRLSFLKQVGGLALIPVKPAFVAAASLVDRNSLFHIFITDTPFMFRSKQNKPTLHY
jgi:hypothetical protein